MKNKFLCVLLSFVMILSLIPTSVFATEKEYVYLSISYDGQYIADKNNNKIVYMPVPLDEIEKVDLTEYGLDKVMCTI